MADYLAGIVARTTGAAPALRPRVPALFEPVGFGVGGLEPAAEPGPKAPGPVEEPGQPAPRERIVEWPREEVRRAPERTERPMTIVAAGRVEPREPERPGEPPAPPPVVAAPAAVPAPPPPTPEAPSILRTEKAPTLAPAIPRGEESSAKVEPPPAESLQSRLRAIADEVLVPEGAPPAPTLAPVSPRPLEEDVSPLRPSTARALETDVAVRTSQGSDEGQTLVHVSIGRVEVRAPAAPAQPERARRRPKPPTRLDDYLGRRNGTRV